MPDKMDYSKVMKGVPYPGATSTSGRWIAPSTGAITTFNTLLNRLYVDDFYLDKPISFSQLACQVTTAGTAGAVIRMGLYTDSDSMPGTLVAEAAGTADTTTTGVKTLNISTGVLSPGRYWLAAVSQGAVCGVYANSKNVDQHWSSSAGGAIAFADVGYVQDSVSGALPATFASVGGSDLAVRIAVKAA